MRDMGVIKSGRFGIETDHISKTERATVSVPMVGFIPCGPLCEEEEQIDGYVRLPQSFVGKGDFFLLTASGESMIEAGIDDGDLVLIRKQSFAKSGDIVVALADGKNTLKRYFPMDKEKKIRLHPENSQMEDIFVSECVIQGVATKVIKNL
jgi:repressor LexA